MKRNEFRMTRRDVLKTGLYTGAAISLPWSFSREALAIVQAEGLSDPALQPKFVEYAPNALDPGFLYRDLSMNGSGKFKPNFVIRAKETVQETGLLNARNGKRLKTTVWGYGNDTISWPGQTVQVMSPSNGGEVNTYIRWENELSAKRHLLPLDTNLHWCYSLPGYTKYTIKKNGVPLIPHLHGGHTDFQFDGNPEFFFSPDSEITGPQWDFVDGGFTNIFKYDNDVPAGNLWYHDHALGITRLNVYAGLAGFYFVRDEFDTGEPENPLGLPAFPYELAYAIQDRMFTERGALFYSAFPGDPFYDDFITGEGVILPEDDFPGGGPTALAEFFGDHMVVNGKIWPKADVEPRNYRMRLLNGCDSRFMVLRFREVPLEAEDLDSAGDPLHFYVIGSDQGLASEAVLTDTLVFEPGSRYDIVFDFAQVSFGSRVIMENIGGDAPFGGAYGEDLEPEDIFPDRQTDRVMAFDVVVLEDTNIPDNFDHEGIHHYNGNDNADTFTRKVALFEGKDEYGRLQPLLGAWDENDTEWKAIPWHMATTETPELNTTEIWEIYNFTGDAHPVHLHLVNFQIIGRNEITFDDSGEPQVIVQHNGAEGMAPSISDLEVGDPVELLPTVGYVENAPKDMVTALPEQVTTIKATFDKPGRYVWHCHILSHEDHEMMRVLQVVPGA